MKKSLCMGILLSCVSLNILAADTAPAASVIDLVGKEAKLGTVSNPEYSKAIQSFTFKRIAKTAEKVTVGYSLLTVNPGCVETAVEYTAVPEHKQTNCTANLNQGHECEEVTFEAFQTAKRVCKKTGLVLGKVEKTFVLNFKKAVKLTATADETYEVSIAQESMKDGKASLRARAVETDSVYKVKAGKEEIKFKAE